MNDFFECIKLSIRFWDNVNVKEQTKKEII